VSGVVMCVGCAPFVSYLICLLPMRPFFSRTGLSSGASLAQPFDRARRDETTCCARAAAGVRLHLCIIDRSSIMRPCMRHYAHGDLIMDLQYKVQAPLASSRRALHGLP
jgi:hypothetical protein